MKKLIIVSGGFDPVHKGHVRMFKESKEIGDYVVTALNSDEWLERKKGKPFMRFEERKEILEAFRYVNEVISFNDYDDTASEAIRKIYDKYNSEYEIYFANGGDRKTHNVPEMSICEELGVKMIWNVGGEKIQSSSKLIKGSR